MSSKLIPFSVYVKEDTSETLILKLSQQDAERATTGKEINEFL